MAPGTQVDILHNPTGWEALLPEWVALWETGARSLPFQRPEWLLPWWARFGQPGGLRIVTVRADGALLALLPFYIYPDTASGLRKLLLVGAGTSDYLDGVFAPGCTPVHIRLALDVLREDRSWDVAHLTQFPAHSPLRAVLAQYPQAEPLASEPCSVRPAVPVRELPGKVRADLRFHSNAARSLGKLQLTVADEHSALPVFDELVRLHSERWRQAGEAGVLNDPSVLAWHRDALPRLARSGMLRLFTLHAGSHLLAVLYAMVDPPGRADRTLYCYLIGYAPQHAKLRPGVLLFGLAIERASEEGVRTIDMLRGDESYKKFWHVEPAPTYGYALPRAARV